MKLRHLQESYLWLAVYNGNQYWKLGAQIAQKESHYHILSLWESSSYENTTLAQSWTLWAWKCVQMATYTDASMWLLTYSPCTLKYLVMINTHFRATWVSRDSRAHHINQPTYRILIHGPLIKNKYKKDSCFKYKLKKYLSTKSTTVYSFTETW